MMTTTLTSDSHVLNESEVFEVSNNHELPSNAVTASRFFKAKDIVDRALAFCLLIPTLPMIALLALVVRLNSHGPGIFCQTRVGRNGHVFTMYKLRSMRIDAEQRTGPVWAAASGDPRVTRLGSWLRQLHLDELPQLLNVVRGEMSLVGPRPERPEFIANLAKNLPGYMERIMVKPGITGLAQINLPSDTDLDSVGRKLTLDREYIITASLGLDLRIVACTVLRLLGLRRGVGLRLLGVARPSGLSASAPNEQMIGTDPQLPVSDGIC